MTLTEFLLARIAEDEAAAIELRDQYPHSGGPTHLSGNWDIVQVTTGYDRVLAECEAKRRVVEMGEHVYVGQSLAARILHGATLRALALPYADHPDFREEWRS